MTPSGNIFSSSNKNIIENTIYELQKHNQIEVDENNAIIGEPIEKITFYGLFCTELDFWNNQDKKFETDNIASTLGSDPFTHLAPGPEQVHQLYLWRSIINLLECLGHDFYAIQYYNEEKERLNSLANQICEDFNAGSGAEKSIFANLTHLMGSPIASWAFTFRGLNEFKVVTALTQTAEFQISIETLVDEESEKHRPKGIDDWELSDDEELCDRIYNEKKKQVFDEVLEIFTVC